MMRLGQFIREKDDDDDCKCPKGMSVLAASDNYCICISDEPEGLEDDDDDEEDDEIDEGFVPAGKPGRSVEFPLIQFDDTVRVKISAEGMFVKIGEGSFFLVPEEERQAIWRVIENRLHS